MKKIIIFSSFIIFVLLLIIGYLLINYKTINNDNKSLNPPKGLYISKTVILNNKEITLTEDRNGMDELFPNKDPQISYGNNENDKYIISYSDPKTLLTLNSEFYITTLDNTDKKYLFTKWDIEAGGSGGEQAIIIWKYTNKLEPIAGLPSNLNDSTYILVKNKQGNLIAKFPTTVSEDLVKFYNSYGFTNILYYGRYNWYLTKEAHYDPHTINLSEYIFKNNQFVKNSSWNKGKVFTTTKKYESYDKQKAFYQLLPVFEQLKEN